MPDRRARCLGSARGIKFWSSNTEGDKPVRQRAAGRPTLDSECPLRIHLSSWSCDSLLRSSRSSAVAGIEQLEVVRRQASAALPSLSRTTAVTSTRVAPDLNVGSPRRAARIAERPTGRVRCALPERVFEDGDSPRPFKILSALLRGRLTADDLVAIHTFPAKSSRAFRIPRV